MIPIVPIPTNYTTTNFGSCASEISNFFPNITQLLEGISGFGAPQKKPIGACASQDYLGPYAQCCVSTSDAINYS